MKEAPLAVLRSKSTKPLSSKAGTSQVRVLSVGVVTGENSLKDVVLLVHAHCRPVAADKRLPLTVTVANPPTLLAASGVTAEIIGQLLDNLDVKWLATRGYCIAIRSDKSVFRRTIHNDQMQQDRVHMS